MQFVVLSSSKGTTFQAILDRIADGSLTAQCLGLVSDREDRGCVTKARAANLPVKIVSKKSGESREEYDERLDAAIRELGSPDLLAAIGWLYLFTPSFVKKWKNKIINVHPSLLPKYPGLHAHEEVLAAKETESGMTIHIVDEGLDTGKILVQKKCSVKAGDTAETLKARVQELEKEWYPKVLQMIHTGDLLLPSTS